MKKLFFAILLGALIGFIPAENVDAQTHPDNLNWSPPSVKPDHGLRADPELFLQGTYVEVGVAQSGSFGTVGAPPAGYHGFPYPGLGFVADYGRDGWNVGTPPQSGDYFVPGTPEERWVLEWTSPSGGEVTFQMATLMSDVDIPQTSLTNTSSGTTNSCVWIGTATGNAGESMLVEMEVSFDDEDLFFVMDVTLTNNGTVPLESVEYMRNVDPDQGLDVGCGYSTSNFVRHQPGWPGSGDTALVIAKSLGCNEIPLGLFAISPYAVVSTEGFTNTDPDAILNTPVEPTEAAPIVDDRAIALAFRFPTMNPGASIQFQYAYVLNQADLDDPGNILPPPGGEDVPLSDYAVYIAFALMVIFVATIIRFRRLS